MACTMVWTGVGDTGWVPGVPWWGGDHKVGSWGAMVGWGPQGGFLGRHGGVEGY